MQRALLIVGAIGLTACLAYFLVQAIPSSPGESQPLVPKGEERIVFPDGSTNIDEAIEELQVVVPEGMEFVASKNGKYYYSVRSPEGERLVPRNRIYFKTEEDAETQGYVHWKE